MQFTLTKRQGMENYESVWHWTGGKLKMENGEWRIVPAIREPYVACVGSFIQDATAKG